MKNERVKPIEGEEARDNCGKKRASTFARMSGYAFHPEALTDIDRLWDYIAEQNIDAADRVVDEIFATLRILVASPHIGHRPLI